MRVGVDVRSLAGAINLAGVSQYTRHLLVKLLAGGEADFLMYAGYRRPENETVFRFLPDLPSGSNIIWSRIPTRLLEYCWRLNLLPIERTVGDIDLFFEPNFFPPYVLGTPLICTVHDLSFIRHPEWFPEGVADQRKRRMEEVVSRSDALIAVSRFTADEIADVWPSHVDKVRVIHEAPGVEFEESSQAVVQDFCHRYKLEKPFLLYVGALELRKNIGTMLEAFQRMYQRGAVDVELVLAGNKGFGSDCFDPLIREGEACGWLHRLGYIPQQDLPVLYAAAQGVCYLSDYEGFGLPPLEALHCGTRVLVSDIPVLREVLGAAALYADPGDVEAISAAMTDLLQSCPAAPVQRLPRDYTWQKAADQTMSLMRQVAR